MNETYIRCSDAATIQKLKNLGFVLLSEERGIATFLNNPKWSKQFCNSDPVVYTSKMNL